MEWEYCVYKVDVGSGFSYADINTEFLTQSLNWYGAQQWELVSTLMTADGGHTHRLGFVFKRPKAPVAPPPAPAIPPHPPAGANVSFRL